MTVEYKASKLQRYRTFLILGTGLKYIHYVDDVICAIFLFYCKQFYHKRNLVLI